MLYADQQNIHRLLTSSQEVDKRTLTIIRAKHFYINVKGLTANAIGNIGVYFPRIFCVRSRFTRHLFTTLHVEVKAVVVGVEFNKRY